MITFERNKDPLKTLRIGNAGNPIKIMGLYACSFEADGITPTSVDSANLCDGDIKKVLWHMEMGDLSEGWEDRYFIGKPTGEDIELDNGGRSILFNIVVLKECIGLYLEYQGVIYRVPKP